MARPKIKSKPIWKIFASIERVLVGYMHTNRKDFASENLWRVTLRGRFAPSKFMVESITCNMGREFTLDRKFQTNFPDYDTLAGRANFARSKPSEEK